MSDAVRDRLLGAHRPTLERALWCADAVVAGWDGASTTDREAVVGPYRATLRRAGLLERLVAALVDAVEAGGHELAARPVPDVPYLALTGEGIVLRVSVADDATDVDRIVVTLRAFEVDPYRRGPELPDALVVEAKRR